MCVMSTRLLRGVTGQRSSRGVGPLRCVGGKKDATNRWVRRVVGGYVCVFASECVCVCRGAFKSTPLRCAGRFGPPCGPVSPSSARLPLGLGPDGQTYSHVAPATGATCRTHNLRTRERGRAIRMRWKCCIICSRLILIARHVTLGLTNFNSMLESTSCSPHAPPLRHREWLWKVTNYVTVNPAEV